jgi:hypothetical protein
MRIHERPRASLWIDWLRTLNRVAAEPKVLNQRPRQALREVSP